MAHGGIGAVLLYAMELCQATEKGGRILVSSTTSGHLMDCSCWPDDYSQVPLHTANPVHMKVGLTEIQKTGSPCEISGVQHRLRFYPGHKHDRLLRLFFVPQRISCCMDSAKQHGDDTGVHCVARGHGVPRSE